MNYTLVLLVVIVVYLNLLSHHGTIAHSDEPFDSSTTESYHSHQYHQHQHHQHHHHFPPPPGLRSSTGESFVDMKIKNETYVWKQQRRLNSDVIERCGTRTPTSNEFKIASDVVTKWITNQRLDLNQLQTVVIDTYFHVILNGGTDEDTPTTEELENQMVVLNDAYRPHGFSFRLLGTTYTNNTDWYNADLYSQEQTDMKSTLRIGDASTLNVYLNQPTRAESGSILLGYAVLPMSYQSNPLDDGIVLNDESVPGGLLFTVNEGKTLVHEVGHWLGLFHTFQLDPGTSIFKLILYGLGLLDECSFSDDGVRDTPRSKFSHFGCSVGADSCPFRRGLDPINNYMEYSDDFCLTEFTPGQTERMLAMWNEYRAP